MIEPLEWSALHTHFRPVDDADDDDNEALYFPMCPVCSGIKPGSGADEDVGFIGHFPGCKLRAVLDEVDDLRIDRDGLAEDIAALKARRKRLRRRSGVRVQYKGPIVDFSLRVDGVRRLIWSAVQIVHALKMRRVA